MAIVGDLSGIEAAVMGAATDPEGWQGVSDAIAEAFPGARPNFLYHDATQGGGVASFHTGYDDAYLRSYEAHYRTVVPGLLAWSSLPTGQIACSAGLVADHDLLRSEFWNDWLKPQGELRQAFMTVLHRSAGRQFMFGVPVEGRAADHVMAPLGQALRSLHPLMRHALAVNRMLLGLRLDAALLRLDLEPAGAAALLLSRQGVVLHATPQAEAMLAEGLAIRHDRLGRLRFCDPTAGMRLDAALGPPSGRAPSMKGLSVRIQVARHAFNVRAVPVLPEAMARLGIPFLARTSEPGLLVALQPDPHQGDGVSEVAGRLGLSRAEAAVAVALAGGATLAEIAQARGTSLHTVRNQVKSSLSRAGAHRQLDLVRLVKSIQRSL